MRGGGSLVWRLGVRRDSRAELPFDAAGPGVVGRVCGESPRFEPGHGASRRCVGIGDRAGDEPRLTPVRGSPFLASSAGLLVSGLRLPGHDLSQSQNRASGFRNDSRDYPFRGRIPRHRADDVRRPLALLALETRQARESLLVATKCGTESHRTMRSDPTTRISVLWLNAILHSNPCLSVSIRGFPS